MSIIINIAITSITLKNNNNNNKHNNNAEHENLSASCRILDLNFLTPWESNYP